MVNTFFMPVPYGRSLGRVVRDAERLAAKCPHNFSLRSVESVSVALSRLKKRGLVVRTGPNKKTLWRITNAGRHHFKSVNESVKSRLPPKDGKIRLVTFDIPEKIRNQRYWLRSHLLSCDYTHFQKSVWVGTRPLPKELLSELKERKLDNYVYVVGLEET